jgi:hypothetical protein
MHHTFNVAELVVGEGLCSRRTVARDVHMDIEIAPREYTPPPHLRCPFLNGKIKAEGVFVEECFPGQSLLAKGRQAVLKLTVDGRWSLVRILVLDLRDIRSPQRGLRHYEWSFLVIGQGNDSLQLFVCPGTDPNTLAIADLLDLLGATHDDVGKAEDGGRVVLTSEGGFRIEKAGE